MVVTLVLQFEPFLHLSSSAPLERYVVLAFCIQYGAGLYVFGTATLINSNIYSNEAYVSVGKFRTKLDSSAPLERYVCSLFLHAERKRGWRS